MEKCHKKCVNCSELNRILIHDSIVQPIEDEWLLEMRASSDWLHPTSLSRAVQLNF